MDLSSEVQLGKESMRVVGRKEIDILRLEDEVFIESEVPD